MSMTIQQQLVLDMLASNLKSAAEGTDKMRARATTIFAASAGLMSFVSAGEFISQGGVLQSGFVLLSIAAGAFVAFISAWTFLPRERQTPGVSSDVERIRDSYLDVSEESAVLKIVADRASCFVDYRDANKDVSWFVRLMVSGFFVQILFVACAVVTRLIWH